VKRLFIALVFMTVNSLAADISGKWSGTWESPERPHYMVLKQDGEAVTGTAGPEAGYQLDISKGKFAGDQLTFDVALENGAVLHFIFKVDGDSCTGQGQIENQGKTVVMKLSAKRVN